MTEREEEIIARLQEIEDKANELNKMAITGADGNLGEMTYHIKCYTKKIISHLLREWKNNAKFTARKEEKRILKENQRKEADKEVQRLNQEIFQKFMK